MNDRAFICFVIISSAFSFVGSIQDIHMQDEILRIMTAGKDNLTSQDVSLLTNLSEYFSPTRPSEEARLFIWYVMNQNKHENVRCIYLLRT